MILIEFGPESCSVWLGMTGGIRAFWAVVLLVSSGCDRYEILFSSFGWNESKKTVSGVLDAHCRAGVFCALAIVFSTGGIRKNTRQSRDLSLMLAMHRWRVVWRRSPFACAISNPPNTPALRCREVLGGSGRYGNLSTSFGGNDSKMGG